MAEIKDKVITAESLKVLHEHNKKTYMSTTTITIPSGRMRGDVDYDGYISQDDSVLANNHADGTNVITDEIQLLCADMNNDGIIDQDDAVTILLLSMYGFESSYGDFVEDVTGNWMRSSDHNMPFYTDIAINGLSSEHYVIITITNEDYDSNFFRAECIGAAIRIYAKLCPISEVKAIVQYGEGDKTNVVIINSLNKGILPIENGGTNSSNGATGLANLFAAGETILSSYQYGDKLPNAGNAGRIFFKKLTN